MADRRTAPADRYEERTAVDPRIPVYLVTGPAGRAKAALVGHIMRLANSRVALALMDRSSWRMASSGAAPISCLPDMVRTHPGGVCVEAGTDPVHAFYQLHLRRLGLLKPRLDYDAVVVEVGHGFDTGAFAAVVQNDTRLDVTYRIAGIVHAVEAGDRPFRNSVPRLRRIGEADTIVLTHADESEEEAIEDAAAAVWSLNPFASVVTIGDFDVDALRPWRLAPGQFSEAEAKRLCRDGGLVTLPGGNAAVLAVANNLYNDPRSNEAADAPLRALRIHMRGEVNLMQVMEAIGELCAIHGRDMLRLSAVLNVRHADRPVALEVIGGTLLHPAYHANARRTDSDICVLGRGLDVAYTRDVFARSHWQASVTREQLCAAM